jgi:uncharacterized protein YndB with AHSA1/START domain
MSAASQVVARVTHRFRFSPEAVFDAWTTGDKVRGWFGPGLGDVVRVAIDRRVGGSFLFVQRRGLDDVEHFGKYVEFERPYRLAFTWQVKGTGDNSRVLVDIADIEGGCEVSLAHELSPQWENYRERTQAAWAKMLTAMAETLNHQTRPSET